MAAFKLLRGLFTSRWPSQAFGRVDCVYGCRTHAVYINPVFRVLAGKEALRSWCSFSRLWCSLVFPDYIFSESDFSLLQGVRHFCAGEKVWNARKDMAGVYWRPSYPGLPT
jgi:hypothetical protein